MRVRMFFVVRTRCALFLNCNLENLLWLVVYGLKTTATAAATTTLSNNALYEHALYEHAVPPLWSADESDDQTTLGNLPESDNQTKHRKIISLCLVPHLGATIVTNYVVMLCKASRNCKYDRLFPYILYHIQERQLWRIICLDLSTHLERTIVTNYVLMRCKTSRNENCDTLAAYIFQNI